MWRQLLALAYPDAGGEYELFVWIQGLHEHAAGDAIDPPVYERPRRTTNGDSSRARVPFESAFGRAGSFAELTLQVVAIAGHVDPEYGGLLRLLSDGEEATHGTFRKQHHQGATYRTLAAIAYGAA
jgi:hypothetical protein